MKQKIKYYSLNESIYICTNKAKNEILSHIHILKSFHIPMGGKIWGRKKMEEDRLT